MDYEKACEILEISQKHLDEDVKKAYFRMALRYHPDKFKKEIMEEEKLDIKRMEEHML